MREQNRSTATVTRRSNVLDGRSGFQLRADWGHVSVLESGGHICELGLNAIGKINPLWKPTWHTIDPFRYDARKYRRTYGPLPEGPLLAGIAGHSISFDFFGPPSAEEIAAGLSTHGEAPVVKWRKERMREAGTLAYSADLPQAQMRLQRTLSLERESSVVYCEEIASNLGSFDRPVSWNHHVTFGPPFLEAEVTLFDMPATHSKVCPANFSSSMQIEPDAEFDWPSAPTKVGGVLNLRTSSQGKYGHYTAHLLDPKLKTAFIAVCNPRLHLLVLYVFARNEYPWVGNWEESYARQHVPWKGREFCRGFEFSSTPFPIPRRDTIDRGPLFGESTYRWLPAKSSNSSKYLIALFEIPADFAGVASVQTRNGSLVVREHTTARKLRMPIKQFL